MTSISAGTIRRWLSQDKIKPWRYHSWQKSTDPCFVEKAGPVLDLYETAQALSQQSHAVICVDEKTSIQARKPLNETRPAIPNYPVQISDRYERKGALLIRHQHGLLIRLQNTGIGLSFDGTTAANRLFGKEFPDLFEWIIHRMDDLPLPRQYKNTVSNNYLKLQTVPA